MQKKILIVDDVEFIIKFEENILNTLSKELSIEILIHTANTVKEAIEKLSDTDYDAIVIDMNLPDGSGIDIAKALQERNQQTRIAGLSIYPYDAKEHQQYFDAFYKKPMTPTLYKENIKQLLELV